MEPTHALLTRPESGKISRIEILPPTDYDELHLPRVKTQLEKSCVHLAQLLNSVGWK
jgi:hypothetical protein